LDKVAKICGPEVLTGHVDCRVSY